MRCMVAVLVHVDRFQCRIDTAAEQQKLVAADVIVLQFPMFWFSMPSLLERWMECTFLHGFAHGSTGDKLRGKKLVISYTTGAPAEAFTAAGVRPTLRRSGTITP